MNKRLDEMNYDELTEHVRIVLNELRTKAYSEGYKQGKFDAELDRIDGLTFDELTEEVQQERRDRIVERAKADIKELSTTYISVSDGYKVSFWPKESEKEGFAHAHNVEFIINSEKRTVVALVKHIDGSVNYRGIAKAHPNDCFNVYIGMVIALHRALGLEVPNEYLNAPQPTEVRVGDVVNSPMHRDIEPYKVARITEWDAFDSDGYYLGLEKCEIIDDSREEGE